MFIRDGEGWEDVKDTSREGLTRLIDGNLNGVRRYDRRDGFDDHAVESIRDHQYDALKRHLPNGTTAQPTSVETTSLVIGMLRNGRTLNGASSRRLAVPILKALIPRAPDNFVELCVLLLDVLIPLIAPTKDRLLDALDKASPEQVERGRLAFLTHIRIVRSAVRRIQTSVGVSGKDKPSHHVRNTMHRTRE